MIFEQMPPIVSAFFGKAAEPAIQAEYADLGYEAWLDRHFASRKPFAPRHERAWRWFASLEKGMPPPAPEVEIWPRGGGKSTTIEMALAWIGSEPNPRRKFALIVSGKQDQANQRLAAISEVLQQVGVPRAMNAFGFSKGWRASQIRTATGFNVAGIGMDTAARGFKLDEFRPDLIVVDDIDDTEDTPKTTAKKERALTRKIFPAGSSDCAIICVQNLIIPDGVFARLYDGRADYLRGRQTYMEPAVHGLEVESREIEDGSKRYFITGGTASWEGQNLEVCEEQINANGLRAFLIESQHEVHGTGGHFFDAKQFRTEPIPFEPHRYVRAWDFAATQGAGDFTVGVLMGVNKERTMFVVLDVVRAQLSPDNVDKLVTMVKAWDAERFGAMVRTRIPQDPGAAGKSLAMKQEREFGAVAVNVTGSKASRATDYARHVNQGNVFLAPEMARVEELDAFLSKMTTNTELDGKSGYWHDDFKREHQQFREDMEHKHDDQVDAAADALNELTPPKRFIYVDA